jgi:hypothetical protein
MVSVDHHAESLLQFDGRPDFLVLNLKFYAEREGNLTLRFSLSGFCVKIL